MRKFNAKNLRREVQKQLKELRGEVGRKAVGQQAGLAMIDAEGLAVSDEVVTGYPLRPSGSSPLKGDSAHIAETELMIDAEGSAVSGEVVTGYPLRPSGSSPLKGDSAHIAETDLMIDAEGSAVSGEVVTGYPLRPSGSSPLKGDSAHIAGTELMIDAEGATVSDGGAAVSDEEAILTSAPSGVDLRLKSQFSIFNSKRPTLPELEQFIRKDYDLRYNVLTEQTEYHRRDEGGGEYRPVTQRVYRTWLTDLQGAGIEFWKIDGLRAAIESMHIKDYHPVTHYLDTLPQWDGEDRIGPLMRRLTRDEVMVGYLSRWMLAFVAQAQGRDNALYANSVAPLLISEQQGWHKSTFCRLLLPPQLRMFYTDNFNLTAESQCERRLTDCLLINLDEYDRYTARKQSTLKNLMQMPSLRMRKAYARNATTLPRIASFIGTSNTPHLLTDTTGSRRFLCVELAEMIDVDTPIDHAQLYAQCMYLLENGERHHFTTEEVADIELRNRAYRHIPPVEEHCRKHFRQPREGETPQLLSAAEIYEYLRQRNPRLMRGVNEQNFGALLREWGFERVEHKHRRVYKTILNCEL